MSEQEQFYGKLNSGLEGLGDMVEFLVQLLAVLAYCFCVVAGIFSIIVVVLCVLGSCAEWYETRKRKARR